MRYEQQSKQQDTLRSLWLYLLIKDWFPICFISGKKEKSMIQEKEKACTQKIAELEQALKKKKQVVIQ